MRITTAATLLTFALLVCACGDGQTGNATANTGGTRGQVQPLSLHDSWTAFAAGELDDAYTGFKHGADQADARAQYWLALCYLYGWGTEEKRLTAVNTLDAAAKAGHEDAHTLMQAILNLHNDYPDGTSYAGELALRALEAGAPGTLAELEQTFRADALKLYQADARALASVSTHD